MIFTTYWFLLFAVVAIVVFRALPWAAARQGWLALACAVFHYHFAGPAGVKPIIVLMVLTYFAGLSRRRAACVAAMVACVIALCFYKYSLFLIGSAVAPFSAGLAASLARLATHAMPGAPPLGVSFFTFEFVHYLFEVRRGGEPIRNPVKFLLFAIFFPSLVAGPIKRYAQFLPSLEWASRAPFSADDLAQGLARVGLGFAKKLLIADQLTLYIDQNQPHFGETGLFGRWLLLVAIAFRILMDFSGYSDIAIGCAQILGIRLPENFAWPYGARDLQQFWQRWHMSLTSWIRDYIYIPLGGSRRGWARRVINGLIAFGLCGLWHGAARHYVLWGVYHGVGLGVCATYERWPVAGAAVSKVFRKEPLAGWVLTQLFSWMGWLLFFYPTAVAVRMAGQLFGVA
ncbi:MAG TPA: MBOAT family O-acyltransferase [Opitutaceae bacterium]|nr:MBOAT family O-acyltransferase [Opitutaceae bacterium]